MPAETELTRDALTGLPGREFIEALDPPFKVRDAGQTWSVLMLDLHGLDAVLRSHGRLVADQILQQTAYMLARNTKQSDELILHGHALFVLVLPRTNRSQAVNLALRLAGNLKKGEYPENAQVPFSLGIAESAEEDRNLSELVERASKSLDASRAMGPGRIAAYPGTGTDSSRGGPVFDHFVDRAEQLEFLRRALDSSVSDGLEAVVILGPAGMGKTRLALELDHYARFRGCLFGIESPLDTRFSYEPDILGAMLRRLTEANGTGIQQTGGSGSGDSADALIALSMTRPVVAVVDDLQSAGQEDLERIASLIRRGEQARILLVLSARTPVPGPVSEWLDTLELFTHLRRLDIPPLSSESSFDLVNLALGTTGTGREGIEGLIGAAGGNPGNLVELAVNLDLFLSRAPRDTDSPDQSSRSAGMADFSAFRAESMAGDLRRFLSAVSGIPWSFSEEEACFLLDIDRSRVSGFAAEAVRSRILESVEENDPATARPRKLFRFTGKATRASFEPVGHERRMLMTRLGDFHSVSDGPASQARKSAYGYFHGLDPAMALDFILASADDAAGRNAYREREEWLGLYVSTASEMSSPPPGFVQKCMDLGELARRHGHRTEAMERFRTAAAMAKTPEESFQSLHLLGKCLLESGDFASAKGCFDRMEDLPSPSPEVTMTSRVALAQLMHSTGHTGEAVGLLSDVEGWMEGGMEGLGGSHLRSEFLRIYGTILAADGDPSSGIGMCNEALEIAERSGDAREQVRVFSALSGIMAPGGAWEERYRILKKADSTARASGDMEGLAGVWAGLGSVHMSLNQVETAESFTEKAARLAEKVGCPALGVDSEIITGLAELHRGEMETALRRFSAALESAKRLGDARSSLVCSMNAARILGSLGSHAQARALLGSLAAVGVPTRAGKRLHADLSFCRGVVEFQAGAVEGSDIIRAALEHIRQARSLYSPHDSLADLEATWFEARCLRELGHDGESAALTAESCRRIGRLMESVDSSFAREDFGQTDFITGLLMQGCDTGAGA